jgi:hypothetical protein
MDAFSVALGITHREVPYPASQSDTTCNVRHDMPEVHACSGCAAWVYSQNWPVIIEYKWQLSYLYWDSTIGHEDGHAICLEDEHYDKVRGVSFILTYGVWIHGQPTVMDVGTPYLAAYTPKGIYGPTDYDTQRCKETLAPRGLSSYYGMYYSGGSPWLYYCDADGSRGRRVAVMGRAPWGEVYWTGNWLPVGPGCYNLKVVSDSGWCFLLNVENAFSWQRPVMRNDVQVGCT